MLQVRFWHVERSANQIASSYDSVLLSSSFSESLLVYLRFNEDEESLVDKVTVLNEIDDLPYAQVVADDDNDWSRDITE